MQVFLTHPNTWRAAEWLMANSPKAVVTTIREGQQLLSVAAAAHTLDPLIKLDGTPYSTRNHQSHPWSKWLQQNYRNWHYLFHLVTNLVYLKYGRDDIRFQRLQDYTDNHVSLGLLWVEHPEVVPFFPHKDLAGDPRLAGLESFEAHRMYTEVKYPKGDKK